MNSAETSVIHLFICLLDNTVTMWYYLQRKIRKKYITGQNYIVTTIAACATVQNEGPASPMVWYLWYYCLLARS